MRCDSLIRKLIVFSIITVYMLIIQYLFAALQSAYAVEEYERKSISCLNKVLLMPGAKQIPSNRASRFLGIVKSEVNLPRFDSNYLPEFIQAKFWKEAQERFSKSMRILSSIRTSIPQIERSIDNAEQELKRISAKYKGKNSLSDFGNYLEEHSNCSSKLRQLRNKRTELLELRIQTEDALFGQAVELLNDIVAPVLYTVLSDPKLLEIRAQKLPSEPERRKFITLKAKELGITRDELEKAMNSAYIYMIFLNNYDRTVTRSKDRKGRIDTTITYSLSGGIVWLKLIPSKDRGHIQFLRDIRIGGSGSSSSEDQADAEAFTRAAENFAGRARRETRKMDCFELKTGILDIDGGKVHFELGYQDGVFVDQEFRVYEKLESGKEKKKGFFYVYRIEDQSSYGRLVIHGAEPGMQIREHPRTGIDISIRRSIVSEMKLGDGELPASYGRFRVKGTAKIPLEVWNLTIQRPVFFRKRRLNFGGGRQVFLFGRRLYVPQLFVTIGLDIGLNSNEGNSAIIDDMVIAESQKNPVGMSGSYFGIHIGLLKKWHLLNRTALCFETLIQYQTVHIADKGLDANMRMASFIPRLGIEFVIHERINIGVSANSAISLRRTPKWRLGSKPLDEGVGPIVTFPTARLEVYTTFRL